MKKAIVFAAALLLVWLFPALVYADGIDTSTGSAVGDVLMIFVKIASFVAMLVGSFLITKLIAYIDKKAGIDIPAATEKTLLDWADQAVGFAYEKSHQLLQNEGTVLNGNDKLNIALQFVLNIAKEHNLEGVAENKIKDYINAKLGMKRLDDNGVVPPTETESVIVAK